MRIDTDKQVHMPDVNLNVLKQYANYLIEKYKKVNNNWEGSGIYWELKQFYDDGRIKDLMHVNDTKEIKIKILHLVRKDIISFCKDWDINIDVMTFEDFLKNNI